LAHGGGLFTAHATDANAPNSSAACFALHESRDAIAKHIAKAALGGSDLLTRFLFAGSR
jgi:hypothetical protein